MAESGAASLPLLPLTHTQTPPEPAGNGFQVAFGIGYAEVSEPSPEVPVHQFDAPAHGNRPAAAG